MKHKKLSKEHRHKLSLAKLLAYKKGEWKGMTGKTHSKETKEKMRLKKLGYVPWNKGKKMSAEYSEIMRIAQIGSKHYNFRDEKHHGWKGKNASLAAIHIWIKRRKPKPNFCECCNLVPPKDLANIGHTYKRNIEDYLWLCRNCHMIQDGRKKHV